MRIAVCCPSYKRPDKVLTIKKYPFIKLYVGEEEADAYRENYPKADIVAMPKGVQGNIARVRNYILEQNIYDNDVVVMMDDDFVKLEYVEQDGFHELKAEDFMEFIQCYSTLCADFGYKMWGVNLNQDNKMYNQYSPFSTTSIILGPFTCFLKGMDLRYDEELALKEDYDMAIQNLNKYRGILRVNKYHYICGHIDNIGGSSSQRNLKKEIALIEKLQQKWGKDIVRIDLYNHNKKQRGVDINPVIKVPIKGI